MDYWIDYRWIGPQTWGITRCWSETEEAFLADLTTFHLENRDVIAFGFRTNPPTLLSERGNPCQELNHE